MPIACKKDRTEYWEQYNQKNKEKISIRKKQYNQDHKEHNAKRMKQYRQEHKKEIIKYNKQWNKDNHIYFKQYRKDNKEHQAEWRKEYRQTPAGKASAKANAHNRRTLTRGLTVAIIQSVYEDNIKKYGRLTCCLCFKPIEFGDDSLEHLTPLSRGGTNDYGNLGIAHRSCNSKKFSMTMEEWYASKNKKE